MSPPRPDGVYSIAATGDKNKRRKKRKVAFQPSGPVQQTGHTSLPPSSSPPLPLTLVTQDQTDAGGDMPLDPPSRYVTISVVDTSSVEMAPATSDGWQEEFDHLETLVTRLNDTVNTMTGVGAAEGGLHTDGSDTSLVINNSTALGASDHVASRGDDVKIDLDTGDTTDPTRPMRVDSIDDQDLSSSGSSSGSSISQLSPRDHAHLEGGMAGSRFNREALQGSSMSIAKENLCESQELEISTSTRTTQLDNSQSYFKSDSSIEMLVQQQQRGEGSGSSFHGNTPSEEEGSEEGVCTCDCDNEGSNEEREEKGDGVDEEEYEQNLMDLLRFGESAHLHVHMV